MPALPTVASDDNIWGTELNNWLLANHNADGSHPGAMVLSTGLPPAGQPDELASIQAQLNAIATAGGGMLYLTPDINPHWITNTLIIPAGVRLVGYTPQGAGTQIGSTLKMNYNFPVNTPMVQIGATGLTEVHNCGLENLSLDCRNIAGSVGIFSQAMQEGCRIENVGCIAYEGHALNLQGYGNQNYSLRNLWLLAGNNSTASEGILCVNSQGSSVWERITVWASGAPEKTGAAVHLTNSFMQINGLHVEGHVDGLLLDGNSTVMVNNLQGNADVTNLLHIASNMIGRYIVTNMDCGGGATTIKDDALGITIPGGGGPDGRVGMYAVGPNGERFDTCTNSPGQIYRGTGAPATGLGLVGAFYLRWDTPTVANQRVYIKTAVATWTGIV